MLSGPYIVFGPLYVRMLRPSQGYKYRIAAAMHALLPYAAESRPRHKAVASCAPFSEIIGQGYRGAAIDMAKARAEEDSRSRAVF